MIVCYETVVSSITDYCVLFYIILNDETAVSLVSDITIYSYIDIHYSEQIGNEKSGTRD